MDSEAACVLLEMCEPGLYLTKVAEATNGVDGSLHQSGRCVCPAQLLFAQCHDVHPMMGLDWSSNDVEMGGSSAEAY
jgi:hypothetical protein